MCSEPVGQQACANRRRAHEPDCNVSLQQPFMYACRVNYTEDLWESLIQAAPSLPPEDVTGLLADSYSLGMAGLAPFPHFLRFAASLPARSNFTAAPAVDTFLPAAPAASNSTSNAPLGALPDTAAPSQLAPVASSPESTTEGLPPEPAEDWASGIAARRRLQGAAGEAAAVHEGEYAAWRALRVLTSKVGLKTLPLPGSSM